MNRSDLAVAPVAAGPLAGLEHARRLLAEVRTVDELKHIGDAAEAIRLYVRKAQLGLELQNDATAIMLQARRRAGELLASMQKHAGGRPATVPENRCPNVSSFSTAASPPPRLAELRISDRQSSQWQQLAAIPAPIFERHLATAKAHGQVLNMAGALQLARQYRPPYQPPPAPMPEIAQLEARDRFDVADAAALPWPDGAVDLIVTSPPYATGMPYRGGGDLPDYQTWLQALGRWLAELYRVARPDGGRLCLNVPLDRALGGWQPVSADAIQQARQAGWQFRSWLLWDKGQAGAGTDRGSLDSASAPNVVAPVESVLVCYRGDWHRRGPAAVPHQLWLDHCGPRGLWHFPGVTDLDHVAPFPQQLPERCISLFSFPDDTVGDPFVGRGTTAVVAARLGRVAWAADRDPDCVARARAWVARERARAS